MSWYITQCREGQEETIVASLKKHLSQTAMEDAFIFRCQRLWRMSGRWQIIEKDMFPGYLFIQSDRPDLLYGELEQFRKIVKIMEEPKYLLSVYKEEEQYLRQLCGSRHLMTISYGYREKIDGRVYIINGPLCGRESWVSKFEWHKRYARVEIPVAGKKAPILAGVDFTAKGAVG